MGLKKTYLKMLLWWKNRNIKPLDDEQKLLHEIVTKMCSKQDSIFLMSPGASSTRYYIENKNHEYFIVLDDEAIKITNHSFYLVRHFHSAQMNPLIQKVRKRIENDRVKMEKEMFKNELDLLRNISTSLDKTIK